jgi:hypothetical protein
VGHTHDHCRVQREFCAPSSRTTHIRNERGKLTMVLYRGFCAVASSQERQPFPRSHAARRHWSRPHFSRSLRASVGFPHRDVLGGALGPLSSGTAGRPNWAAIFFAIRSPSEIFVQCSVANFLRKTLASLTRLDLRSSLLPLLLLFLRRRVLTACRLSYWPRSQSSFLYHGRAQQ